MTKWVLSGDCQHWVCIQVLAVTHCPPERGRQVSLEIAAWAGKKAPPFILVLWSMKWKPCSETADGATSCSVEGCGEIAWFHSNSGFSQCMGERAEATVIKLHSKEMHGCLVSRTLVFYIFTELLLVLQAAAGYWKHSSDPNSTPMEFAL